MSSTSPKLKSDLIFASKFLINALNKIIFKAAPRFELGVEILQTSALPLGDAAATAIIKYSTNPAQLTTFRLKVIASGLIKFSSLSPYTPKVMNIKAEVKQSG